MKSLRETLNLSPGVSADVLEFAAIGKISQGEREREKMAAEIQALKEEIARLNSLSSSARINYREFADAVWPR